MPPAADPALVAPAAPVRRLPACTDCGLPCDARQPPASGDGAAVAPRCPLCLVAADLDRPACEREAVVVWLPEMSQSALSVLVRQMHLRLHSLDEPLDLDAAMTRQDPQRLALHAARSGLAARARDAEARIGTASPRRLAGAIRRLPPAGARRARELVSGLRLLPLGRFFEGGHDVYPNILAAWAKES